MSLSSIPHQNTSGTTVKDRKNWTVGYKPEPVSLQAVVDAEISVNLTQLEKKDPKLLKAFVDGLAESIWKTMNRHVQKLQTEELVPVVDGKPGETERGMASFADKNAIGHYVRDRVAAKFEVEDNGVYGGVITTTYTDRDVVEVMISDPNFKGGRKVYLRGIAAVSEALGQAAQKGVSVKISNISDKNIVTGGEKSWKDVRIGQLAT